jgi:hypothetical protein
MPLFEPLPDYPPPAQVAPLVKQRSPHADAGGGGAIVIRPYFPGPGGTAPHQSAAQGFTEGPPWDPIEPVREGFTFKR